MKSRPSLFTTDARGSQNQAETSRLKVHSGAETDRRTPAASPPRPLTIVALLLLLSFVVRDAEGRKSATRPTRKKISPAEKKMAAEFSVTPPPREGNTNRRSA